LIYSWQQVLTDHQVYTFRELCKKSKQDMQAFVCHEELVERKSQGWSKSHKCKEVSVVVLPGSIMNFIFITRTIIRNRNDINIFCGPFGDFFITYAFFLSCLISNKTVMISEPYLNIATSFFSQQVSLLDFMKFRLRPILYRIYSLFFSKNIYKCFCISKLAYDQFSTLGVEEKKLFHFGYFLPQIQLNNVYKSKDLASESIDLVYIGALIPRKNLSLLVRAIEILSRSNIALTLDVYGPGTFDPSYSESPYITYKGSIPFGSSPSVIGKYDFLCLPSLHDGWGVVVNEAISVGVPVIVSDKAGASSVVKSFDCGYLFDPLSLDSLIEALILTKNSECNIRLRRNCQTAAEVLNSKVAGEYLSSIIFDVPEPVNPWCL
jgi:glycosyltransferase involved in cell wall biosynthesis